MGGRITDSPGRTIDCTNCVIIMTSNLGSEHLMRAMDKSADPKEVEAAKQLVLNTIRHSLRPELLNRLDDVVVFSPLAGNVLRKVVRLQLSDGLKRLEELDVSMTITDAAVNHVLQEAHDPQMGARPLKRYLEKHLVSRLSTLILNDDLLPGSAVAVDWRHGAGGKNDWDFTINAAPNGKDDDDMQRTLSATLGRAGSHDKYATESLDRTESQGK